MPQNTAPQGLTPEEEQAYQLLFNQVHAPVFFEKLAAHGIEPQSPEEMEALLEMGTSLMFTHQADQQKQAAARGSFIIEARDSLNAALSQYGIGAPTTPDDGVIKQAAAAVVRDESVRAAVLAYQGYLARQAQA
jgi:hypothetical protein